MSASPSQDVLLPVGTYRITPGHSSVSFTTRHLFGLGQVAGKVAVAGGGIHVADPTERSSVTAQLAASRVDRYAHGVTLMKGMAARHLDLHITVVAVPV